MTTEDGSNNRPVSFRDEHLRRYLETNGADGHIWRGMPTLLLTTSGQRTGTPFQTPLIYGEEHGRYLIVASKGGAERHPQWYRNLRATPEVELQVGAERFSARARTATAEEKPALWKLMTGIWPGYDEYQAKTTRVIPLVILERA